MLLFQSASTAGVMAAVGGFPALHRPLVFTFQEGGRYADINMSPGQEFIRGALALGVKAGFKPTLSKGAKPVFIIKVFIPGIKD